MKLQQVLETLLWAGITGIVFAVFKAVFDRTIVKDLKNSDLIEETLRKDVDENRLMITRLFQEMDKVKSKQEIAEKTFQLELQQLQRQYNEMRSDMKEGFLDLKRLLMKQDKP